MPSYHIIALISHAGKVMLRILQAILQTYMNQELSDVQAGSRKGRGTRDQIAYTGCIRKIKIIEKKKSTSALLTMPKPSTVWITINWKILKEMGIPDHLTCLLRNLYAGQEATVRTRLFQPTVPTKQLERQLVPNWERRTSMLYIITLII